MILMRFDLDDIEKCKTFNDVFEMFGIGLKEDSKQGLNIRNKEVFGERAYYANMIMNDTTFMRIYDRLQSFAKKSKKGGKVSAPDALQWINYSPVSSGPRYKQVEEMTGMVSEDVIYIITPDDPMYEEDPTLKTKVTTVESD